jgi:TP901 family phage tail tape measure protein
MSNLGNAVMNIKVNVTGLQNLRKVHAQLIGIQKITKSIAGNFNWTLATPGGGGGGQQKDPSKVVSKFTQKITDLRSASFALRDAGRQFTMFSGAVLAAFYPVIKVGSEFQQSVQDVRAVISSLQADTVISEMRIGALSDQFLRLAETTEFTAVQVANAAKQLALAGFSFAEIQNSLEGVINLASAGGLAVEDAARITATILRSYQISASNAGRVSDVLAQIQSNANTTVGALGEAFKMVSGTSNALGVSLEETAAALGLLANQGLNASIGGTSLNRLFQELSRNGGKLTEVLNKFGASFDDIDLRQKSLSEVVRNFEKITNKSREAKFEIMAAMDLRGARAFAALIAAGADNFDRMAALANDAAGAAERIRNIRLNTVQGDVLLLKSAFETLLIEVFNTFEKDLRKLLEYLREVVLATIDWVKENQELVRSWVTGMAELAGYVLVLGQFLYISGQVVGTIAGLLVLLKTLSLSVSILNVKFMSLGAVMATFKLGILGLIPAVKALGVAIKTNLVGILLTLIGLLTAALFTPKWAELKPSDELLDAMEQWATRAGVVIEAIEGRLVSYRRAISNTGKAFDALKKGGGMSPSDIQALKQSPLYDAATGEFSVSKLKVQQAGQLGTLTLLRSEIQRMERLSPKDLRTEDYQDRIDGLRAQYDELKGIVEETDKSIKNYEILFDLAGKTPKEIRDYEGDLNKEIVDLEQKAQLEQRLGKLTADRQNFYNEEIAKRQQILEVIKNTVPELLEMLQIAKNQQKLDVSQLEDRVRIQRLLEARLEDAKKASESIQEALLNTQGAISELQETSHQKAIRQIKEEMELRRANLDLQLKLLEAQRDVAANQGDFITASNIDNQIMSFMDEFDKVDELGKLKTSKIEKEVADRQADILDNLELERAKREKNFQEYEKIIRRTRKAEVDALVDEKFETASQADIDRFRKLKEEELDAFLADEKESFEEKPSVDKLDNVRSDVADAEKDIMQSLISQVKSMEQAVQLANMLHRIERQREEAVKKAALDALRQRDSARRAEEALKNARPEDVNRLKSIADRRKTLADISGEIAGKRASAAGLSGVTLSDLPGQMNTAGQQMAANAQLWVDAVTQTFQQAPAQWLQALSGFSADGVMAGLLGAAAAAAQGGSPPPPANTPGPQKPITQVGGERTINFIVNNNTDAKKLQRMMIDTITKGQQA